MIHRERFRLLSSDVDPARRLRLSRLFTLLQEAAIAHTEQLGMGRDKTLDRGILWALAMRRIRVNRLPEYDERIELTSWPGETMHVLFPRYSRLTGEGGEVLAEGSALWILMDAERRERVFPDEAGIHVPGMGAEGIPLPRALKAPTVEGVPFRELFQPGYLGLLGEEDVREEGFARAGQDIELAVAGGCRVKLHAGPGLIQRGNVKDSEIKFILDNDVFMNGKLPVEQCAPALQTVHIQADRLFAGALTQRLHEAMEPELLD